MFLVTSPNM